MTLLPHAPNSSACWHRAGALDAIALSAEYMVSNIPDELAPVGTRSVRAERGHPGWRCWHLWRTVQGGVPPP